MDIIGMKRDLANLIDETFDHFEQRHHCLPSMEEFRQLISHYESQFIGVFQEDNRKRHQTFWQAVIESEAEVRQARTP